MKQVTHESLFATLQGLGNSIIQWPVIEFLKTKKKITVAAMNNGSAKFYKEFGHKVIPINSRKEIISKLVFKRFESVQTPCPSWRRECLVHLLTRSSNKSSIVHKNKKYSLFFKNKNHSNVKNNVHDLENTINTLFQNESEKREFYKFRNGLKLKFNDEVLKNKKYTVLHPTASTQNKFYPKIFWKELIQIALDNDHEVYIVGGGRSSEKSFCNDLISYFPQIHYFENRDFKFLAKIICNANYFIGLDSSICHFAAHFDISLTVLWSFANFKRIYPYGNNSKVYIPKEVISNTNYQYPKNELPYLKRARAQSVFSILQGQKKESFTLRPPYIEPIRFYTF